MSQDPVYWFHVSKRYFECLSPELYGELRAHIQGNIVLDYGTGFLFIPINVRTAPTIMLAALNRAIMDTPKRGEMIMEWNTRDGGFFTEIRHAPCSSRFIYDGKEHRCVHDMGPDHPHYCENDAGLRWTKRISGEVVLWENRREKLTADEAPIGWRCWRVIRNSPENIPPFHPFEGTFLSSMAVTATWTERRMVCDLDENGKMYPVAESSEKAMPGLLLGGKVSSVGKGYGCHGIHSFIDYNQMVRQYGLATAEFHAHHLLAIGQVKHYGQGVIHRLGIRTQVVTIERLWLLVPYSPEEILVGGEFTRIEQDIADELSQRYEVEAGLLSREKIHGWGTYYMEGKEDG